jgi:hypothetical protein
MSCRYGDSNHKLNSDWIRFASTDEMNNFKEFLKKKYSIHESLDIIRMLFDSKRELESQTPKIIKGSNHEYDKYPLYPLLSNN